VRAKKGRGGAARSRTRWSPARPWEEEEGPDGGARASARRGGGGTGLGQEREKRAGLSGTGRMRKGKRKGRLGRGEGDGLGRPLGWAVGGKEKEMGLGRLG